MFSKISMLWLFGEVDTTIPVITQQPGGHLNTKMLSYQYRDPHVKDNTVSWLSYFQHGNPHTCGRQSLYWDGGPDALDTWTHWLWETGMEF